MILKSSHNVTFVLLPNWKYGLLQKEVTDFFLIIKSHDNANNPPAYTTQQK